MAKAPKSREIQATLAKLLRSNVKPKGLLKETRKAHPEASKGDIIRAAFASMIELSDKDPAAASTLQGFAIAERAHPEADA
jgi:hypothetical protein